MNVDTNPTPQERRNDAPFLELRGVAMAFGGLLALGGVDLDVVRGERLAVLGPNGAGKTTLFNVIAGDLHPTGGTVHINGVDCTRTPSRRRPALGVARTYQKTRLFAGLTVEDNLQLAWLGKFGRHRSLRRHQLRHEGRDAARQAARNVWLSDQIDAMVGDLSHGQQRQLEVGMAAVTEPELMMLDEPASGLSRGERERLTELLTGLAPGTTLVLIEHDMDVALSVAQRVVVMADGLVIATGNPSEIRTNPLVNEVYLGTAGSHV